MTEVQPITKEDQLFDESCAVEGCDRRGRKVNGICMLHYNRFNRLGSFDLPIRPTSVERFWGSFVRDPSGCWIWAKALSTEGYGMMASGRRSKRIYAHRFSYSTIVGPIPDGLQIDHLCRNRACVNPMHMEPVTPVENVMRGEGPCALHARQTHCKRGHEFTPENTYSRRTGNRECRICIRDRERKRQRRAA